MHANPDMIMITGWGTIYFGGPVSNTLQEVGHLLLITTDKSWGITYSRLERN